MQSMTRLPYVLHLINVVIVTGPGEMQNLTSRQWLRWVRHSCAQISSCLMTRTSISLHTMSKIVLWINACQFASTRVHINPSIHRTRGWSFVRSSNRYRCLNGIIKWQRASYVRANWVHTAVHPVDHDMWPLGRSYGDQSNESADERHSHSRDHVDVLGVQ